MFSHLGFIVALTINAFGITLAASRQLVVIQLDSQARLLRNADATIGEGNPAARHDFVRLGLPWIMDNGCHRRHSGEGSPRLNGPLP
jgi:hypothetical protein